MPPPQTLIHLGYAGFFLIGPCQIEYGVIRKCLKYLTDVYEGRARCSNWQRKRKRRSVGGGGGGRHRGDMASRLLLKERESQQKSLLFQIISLFEINLT